jgi:uncharacterized RDD family membrane protein YckC
MADQWFYGRGGQSSGPVTLEQLRAMAAGGQVIPTDLVWTAGMPQWQSAGQVLTDVTWPAAVPPTPVGILGYHAPAEIPYAGLWKRFCAAFLDGLILGIPLLLVRFGILPWSQSEYTRQDRFIDCGLTLLEHVIYWLYYALMESSAQSATLGKMAVGIRVTDLEGARISFGRATGRYFGKFVSAIILMIGFIMAAFTQRKQALHDLMAGTLVIKGKA